MKISELLEEYDDDDEEDGFSKSQIKRIAKESKKLFEQGHKKVFFAAVSIHFGEPEVYADVRKAYQETKESDYVELIECDEPIDDIYISGRGEAFAEMVSGETGETVFHREHGQVYTDKYKLAPSKIGDMVDDGPEGEEIRKKLAARRKQ